MRKLTTEPTTKDERTRVPDGDPFREAEVLATKAYLASGAADETAYRYSGRVHKLFAFERGMED